MLFWFQESLWSVLSIKISNKYLDKTSILALDGLALREVTVNWNTKQRCRMILNHADMAMTMQLRTVVGCCHSYCKALRHCGMLKYIIIIIILLKKRLPSVTCYDVTNSSFHLTWVDFSEISQWTNYITDLFEVVKSSLCSPEFYLSLGLSR